MGLLKREMERRESMLDAATGIAVQARALMRCPIHEDCVFEGSGDVEGAYKLGNYKFTAGEVTDVFSSRREMTDCIKKVVEEYEGTECPSCAKVMDE